ncbi:hypothetical protein [Aquibacillus albus]|uniref:Uncharacterized protein n=1 Tax=Aquibacillus albus TaxID=1168171 RepID=A0ABS2N5C6_9BACI|nr:hypothetical protein [Aquibacillus albus]MBM7573341.1 hypothetical protein [Aquibacillus albus]
MEILFNQVENNVEKEFENVQSSILILTTQLQMEDVNYLSLMTEGKDLSMKMVVRIPSSKNINSVPEVDAITQLEQTGVEIRFLEALQTNACLFDDEKLYLDSGYEAEDQEPKNIVVKKELSSDEVKQIYKKFWEPANNLSDFKNLEEDLKKLREKYNKLKAEWKESKLELTSSSKKDKKDKESEQKELDKNEESEEDGSTEDEDKSMNEDRDKKEEKQPSDQANKQEDKEAEEKSSAKKEEKNSDEKQLTMEEAKLIFADLKQKGTIEAYEKVGESAFNIDGKYIVAILSSKVDKDVDGFRFQITKDIAEQLRSREIDGLVLVLGTSTKFVCLPTPFVLDKMIKKSYRNDDGNWSCLIREVVEELMLSMDSNQHKRDVPVGQYKDELHFRIKGIKI